MDRNGEEATLVLHAAQMGVLPMVAQRLDERARKSIKPGNVYVWEQQGYGPFERWTDGMHWSDSRGGVDSFLKYVQTRVEDERCASTSASVWLSSCRDSDDCVRLDDKSEPPLIKRTYSAIVRRHGVGAARKCHVVAYSSTS
ncbi:Gti1/Pac2 family-domain-containing protein, partial [Schizophyllum commune]